MKILVVATASVLIFGNHALAQSTYSSHPTTAKQNNLSGSADPAKNPSSWTTGSGRTNNNDNTLGSGTRTGTTIPNSTGSSGTSGTTGVDSSTSNSH